MPYLIEVRRPFPNAPSAADALQAAFMHIIGDYLRSHPVIDGAGSSEFETVRQVLSRPAVKVSQYGRDHADCWVAEGEWDRGEVETNLRQVEVLILALRSPVLARASDVKLSPTQQRAEDVGGLLEGRPFALEAFGGMNVRNNDKLGKDARALAAMQVTHRFFACRSEVQGMPASGAVPGAGTFKLANDPARDGVDLYRLETSGAAI